MKFLYPVGQEIIDAVRPADNQTILDIASGTGEPGLTIAGMLKAGKVIITDLAADMLAIAAEKARQRKITNVETKQCDVCELPFADNYFDAVSCRFGFMFFPDMQLAASEMKRVLKTGGRIATSVWSTPDKNFWVTAIMGTIQKHIPLAPPIAGAPGMFRCGQPGFMKNIFEQAGFKHITEKEIQTNLAVGTAETYWALMTEVGAPIVAALSNADEPTIQTIKNEVFELIHKSYGEKDIVINGNCIVTAAEK